MFRFGVNLYISGSRLLYMCTAHSKNDVKNEKNVKMYIKLGH